MRADVALRVDQTESLATLGSTSAQWAVSQSRRRKIAVLQKLSETAVQDDKQFTKLV